MPSRAIAARHLGLRPLFLYCSRHWTRSVECVEGERGRRRAKKGERGRRRAALVRQAREM